MSVQIVEDKSYSEALTQRVNELFHDAFKDEFDDTYCSLRFGEEERWLVIAKRFFSFKGPARILDIGTGTGFVPSIVAPFLCEKDTLICTDISGEILEVAKKKLSGKGFKCAFEFLKIERGIPYRLPFENNSVDAVTVNQVLHHVQDTEAFLKEVDRVLKPMGLFFVGNEPNKQFYTNRFLNYNYTFLKYAMNPMYLAYLTLRMVRLSETVKRMYFSLRHKDGSARLKREEKFSKINESLLREGLISSPLSSTEIENIVDAKWSSRTDFNPWILMPTYKMKYLETYNHVGSVNVLHHGSRIIEAYDRFLLKRYPKEGSMFFAVYKKPPQPDV